MPFGRDGCKCCDRIIEELQSLELLNQFEGLVLQPLCDDTSGDVVGYLAVVRTEENPPVTSSLYFDTGGNIIGAQPANSSVCVAPVEYNEMKVLCEATSPDLGQYTQFLRRYTIDSGGSLSVTNTELDGVTPYVVNDESDVYQCPDITSEIVCYQAIDNLGEAAINGGFDNAIEGEAINDLGAFGGTNVTLKTETPVGTVGGSNVQIRASAPFPTQTLVTLEFSRPVLNFTLSISAMENDPGTAVSRLHSFNHFPDSVLGNIDNANGTSIESTVPISGGGLMQWDNVALTTLSFVYESYESASPSFSSVSLGAFSFEETTGTNEIRRAKCITDTNAFRRYVDAVTGLSLLSSSMVIVECPPEPNQQIVVGYIQECTQFDNMLPVSSMAGFVDDAGVNTINFASVNVASLIRNEILKAQRLQQQQEKHGLTVTEFVVNTLSGEVYSFPPSAYIAGAGTLITLDDANITTWGIDQSDTVTDIVYSTLDGCSCSAVEVLQEITDESNIHLLDVVDPSLFDEATGFKPTLLNDQGVLPFGTLGPFAGPCPSDIQVLDVNALCCSDDLAVDSPAVASQRLAWLDGSDASIMLDAVGGTPIAGTGGENVFEVQDKINPGVSPSFVVPTPTGGGDVAPINPPDHELDQVNGLSVLEFNSANRERLRLDTNNPAGSSFTLFYLVSATDPVLANNACILSVLPNNSDGSQNIAQGTWQLSLDDLEPSFIFRMTMNGAEFGLGVDPPMLTQTGPFSDEFGPSNPDPNFSFERAIATSGEFFNGQVHLVTVTLDATSGILSCFFDGELRMQTDLSTFPLTIAAFASDYFRIMGNRVGVSFLSGQLAEMFFADTAMSRNDIATVNAYLVCKWGIDPSLAAGGLGDLTLATTGSFSAPTPFVQRALADGTIVYTNTLNGQEFPLPPLPGLSICGGDEIYIPAETVCYADLVSSGNNVAGNFAFVNTGNTIDSGSFGGVTIQAETALPHTLQGGPMTTMIVISPAPYPNTQLVTLRFSEPVINFSLDIAGLDNDGPTVERLRDFTTMPDSVTGDFVIDGLTVRANVGVNNGTGDLVWNSAVSEISFIFECDVHSSPVQTSLLLRTFNFDLTTNRGTRIAKCLVDSNLDVVFLDALTGQVVTDPFLIDCGQQSDLTVDVQRYTGAQVVNFASNTIHSIAVTAVATSVDINGTSLPTGFAWNAEADEGSNIATPLAITLDVTGDVIITTGVY